MSSLETIVIDCNELTPITVNSIRKNMPRAKYKVVKEGKSKIGTAVANCDKPTLVVTGGIVLNIRHGDVPSIEKIKQYHLCKQTGSVCRYPKHSSVYKLIGSPITKGFIDLSILLLILKNGMRFQTLIAAYWEIKVLYMPRYFNP